MLWHLWLVVGGFCVTTVTAFRRPGLMFERRTPVTFLTAGRNGKAKDFLNHGSCQPGQKYAIIVHGWRESCKTEWVGPVVGNLTRFRGGCVICMDYTQLSHVPYRRLVRNFEPIVDILTHKLRQLEKDGFKPEDGYMFGFSFGAHVALHAALSAFGENRFGEIDLCEPAGPGFDGTMREVKDMSLAAQNVQCIHTSNTLGTRSRSCHQDWNMGRCGDYQVGAMPNPKGHHGLCPYFYANAFEHPFYAVQRPVYCSHSSRVATEFPEDYQMGYMETRLKKFHGIFYAETYEKDPFNKP